ncbi:MAG: type 4a pilus biogenesis protein PilO [Pyrinomonadaceae bacterium]
MTEKFKALAWHFQLMVLVGIAALLYASVYYFIIQGMSEEVRGLNDQVEQLKIQNTAAKNATEHIAEFRSKYASVAQEYDELKVLLPEEREITNVLQGLQNTASESRLIVMRFSPRDDAQEEFIMAKPVEIEVDSNFNNLRAFFDQMAKLQRIVSITDFKLNQLEKQTGDRTLHASFLLKAYYAAPESAVNTTAPQKPGAPVNGQPPAPNPPAAVPSPVAQ